MRWVWHTFWIMSLLLAVGVGALWVSGQWWSYHHNFRKGPERWFKSGVYVSDGFVMFAMWHPYEEDSLILPSDEEGFIETKEPRWWKDPELVHEPTLRFAWVTFYQVPRGQGRFGLDWLYFPLVHLIVLFLLLPSVQVGRWVFYLLRDRRGVCVNCGYDLRGSQGACPECGYVSPSVAKAMALATLAAQRVEAGGSAPPKAAEAGKTEKTGEADAVAETGGAVGAGMEGDEERPAAGEGKAG